MIAEAAHTKPGNTSQGRLGKKAAPSHVHVSTADRGGMTVKARKYDLILLHNVFFFRISKKVIPMYIN